jgi:hypothetical protein
MIQAAAGGGDIARPSRLARIPSHDPKGDHLFGSRSILSQPGPGWMPSRLDWTIHSLSNSYPFHPGL